MMCLDVLRGIARDPAQAQVLVDDLLGMAGDEPVLLARLSHGGFTDRLVEKFRLPVQGWRGAAGAMMSDADQERHRDRVDEVGDNPDVPRRVRLFGQSQSRRRGKRKGSAGHRAGAAFRRHDDQCHHRRYFGEHDTPHAIARLLRAAYGELQRQGKGPRL